MPDAATCPQCGSPLPNEGWAGLCPNCVVRVSLEQPQAAQGTSGVPERGPAAPEQLPSPPQGSPEKGSAPSKPGIGIEQTGMSIGRYKLLQQIGEGGFGVVFMAEQTEPVQRKVALKVIKAGMDTREVIARFEAERQALALMDHPNIARVLDGGATESGRPYFVMELVRGLPITEYCDQCNLSTRERLELFVKVCQAVQHAHQKGVIHRDLKPGNVLVTLHDGEPVPKVIDFGVAKALGQKLTDKTLFTRFEQLIGTPAYMSPEQAALSGLDIDTRSDIYSLGVLLYELLTGVTPFDAETLRLAALDEIRRMIRETEPAQPSTRLLSLGDRLEEVAKRRHAEPATLTRLVRGDLDWITMKALEKDRRRRYETVNALAADLDRHLNHEPVLARPPSALYRFERAFRRHRGAFAAGAALAIALLLGAIISTWQAVRIADSRNAERRQRQRAQEALLAARQHAYAADLSLAQRALDEGNVGRARSLLDSLRPQRGEVDLRGIEWRYSWKLCQRDKLFPATGTASGQDGTEDSPSALEKREPNTIVGVFSKPVFSHDCRYMAVRSRPNEVTVWKMSTKRRVAVFKQAHLPLGFSDDGAVLKTALFSRPPPYASRSQPAPGREGDDSLLAVQSWLVAAGTNKITVPLSSSLTGVGSATISPDGSILAAGNTNGDVMLWETSTGKVITKRQGNGGEVDLVFSPDGKALAVTGPTETATLLALPGGEKLATLVGRPTRMASSIFSPDGKLFITATINNTICLWEVATGNRLGQLSGHEKALHDIAISPDGQTLLSAGEKINFWNLATQREVSTLRLRAGDRADSFEFASFSPNGQSLAALDGYGILHIWEAPTLAQADAQLMPTQPDSLTNSSDSSAEGLLNYGNATSVSITLGFTNVEQGITLGYERHAGEEFPHLVYDGDALPNFAGGQECYWLARQNFAYLYFLLDTTFKEAKRMNVTAEVEFFAPARGSFEIQYDSWRTNTPDDRYAATARRSFEGSDTWQTVTFHLKNGRFENRQNGIADFRLCVWCPEFYVHRVTIARE